MEKNIDLCKEFVYICGMDKSFFMKRTTVLALALAGTVLAQIVPIKQVSDSLAVPKNFENFNEFQIEKWGPITYKGVGKCDILDLYQKSVAAGMGYSTVVDYHSKETKLNGQFSCESWGLGLSFKVVPDSNAYSENYGLSGNSHTVFSARSKNAVKKLFESEQSFLEVESIMPVTYQSEGKCFTLDFLFNKANEESGFHGIIDMKANESNVNGKEICLFWGLAVKYKRRDVVEKVVTKRRVIEVIKVPRPKPDTVYVPTEKPATKNCCIICSCNN